MTVLYIVGIIATIFHILALTVSVATGVYYVAELAEEYTTAAKKAITLMVLFDLTIYIALIFADNLPWSMVLCGLAAQVCHFLILKDFPFFTLSSLQFIGASILLVLNHYLAITYFMQYDVDASQMLGYFTICLWIVPFGFIVTLNVNDNVLPTHGMSPMMSEGNDAGMNYFSEKNKTGSLLSLFNYAKESIFSDRGKKSF